MVGTITAQWTATCGVCGRKQELPDAHGTRFAARCAANDLGWHHRAKRGWVCPTCWQRGDNMLIICDLIDLGDMLEAACAALNSPPRADDRLRELRQYICAHCADKDKHGATTRCHLCKIRAKNA